MPFALSLGRCCDRLSKRILHQGDRVSFQTQPLILTACICSLLEWALVGDNQNRKSLTFSYYALGKPKLASGGLHVERDAQLADTPEIRRLKKPSDDSNLSYHLTAFIGRTLKGNCPAEPIYPRSIKGNN